MAKRGSDHDWNNKYLYYLTIILVVVLLIFKAIGDLIIQIFKPLITLIFKSYNIFGGLIIQTRNFIGNIYFNLSIQRGRKVPIKKPCQIILYQKPKWFDHIAGLPVLIKAKISQFSLPSLKLPKKVKLPLSLRLLFLKIKFFLLGALVVGIVSVVYQINQTVKLLPNPAFLSERDIPTTTKIYDRNGRLLYEIYADENRTPIKLADVPQIVKDATIAIEDRDFYSHKGFSLKGIVRAAIHNFKTGQLQGGSTITQQLIRSALLTPEKTLNRKIKEFILSLWAEHIYSKDQILEMYLNQVPYGGTVWGIEAASETYFGKKVKDLTLAEAAFLAGLPAAPTIYSPFGAHPELAKVRQGEVLDKLKEAGFISIEAADKTKKELLNFRRPAIPIAAPHFVMYVKELLEQQYGLRLVEQGGLRVVTTLDLSVQEMAQRIVTAEVENLKPLSVGNGAALITNPKNGEILAMAGSADYFDRESEGNVNITTSLRQPGSSIKVVNYAKALSLGYTAASILDDSPITYRIPGLPPYSPVNYDGKFHGRIPLRIALASSYNVPAVKVLASIGINNMIEQGKLMGITSWNEENRFGLSLTLGGGEVTMIDMAKVYGTLANGGKRKNLTPILQITNFRGESLAPPTLENEIQAVSPAIAFILTNILSDNNARTPAFGPNSQLVIPGKTVAVKTGTSDNKRDNWAIGYIPDYVVVTWVGNNNNAPMNQTLTSGITGAAPIWNEIMTKLLKELPDKPFTPPEDIISLTCFGRTEYFIRGTEPKGGCIVPPAISSSPSNQTN